MAEDDASSYPQLACRPRFSASCQDVGPGPREFLDPLRLLSLGRVGMPNPVRMKEPSFEHHRQIRVHGHRAQFCDILRSGCSLCQSCFHQLLPGFNENTVNEYCMFLACLCLTLLQAFTNDPLCGKDLALRQATFPVKPETL